MLAVLLVVALILLLAAVYTLLTYNRLVALRLAVDNSWAQVDAALAQRHDLIPNLVAAVQGYAAHERSTLDGLTEARAAAESAPAAPTADLGRAEARIGTGIGQALVIAEAYPDLKASANFQDLQARLTRTEDQIQVARRVYNDVVERYATKTGTVPSVFVARAFGFGPREFFRAEVGAHAVPAVELGGGAA